MKKANMSIFRKSKPRTPLPWTAPRGGRCGNYAMLERTAPTHSAEMQYYRRIRETLPIVDAAIQKLIRLTGGFHVSCGNAAAEKALNRFLHTVDTGWGQKGLQSFLDSYLDSMLTNGMAAGEILTDESRSIRAVICRDVSELQVSAGRDPTELSITLLDGGVPRPAEYPGLILFTPFHPETAHPWGVSMLRSMPYLAETLLTVYESIRANYERSGALRYAVTCKPGSDPLERINAEERMQTMAEEWSRAMQSTRDGSIRDFITLGDIDIRTIGADAAIPDTEAPVRQILEQLVSKTGVPPFLLGLSWSSTERMSSQQADMMTSEIWAIRRPLTNVVEQVCDLWMAMHGYADEYEVVWDDINLQDIVEESRARLYDAQTEELTQKIREDAK